VIYQAGRFAYSVMSLAHHGEWRRISPAALESIESADGPMVSIAVLDRAMIWPPLRELTVLSPSPRKTMVGRVFSARRRP
jgi:hypothetical protein